MKELILVNGENKTTISIDDECDEITIDRWHLIQDYELTDYQVGSTMHDINQRMQELDKYLAQKKFDEALQVRKNMQQTFLSAKARLNYKSLQFGCMISSVNGVKLTDEDYKEHNIMKLVNSLGAKGLRKRMVYDIVDNVKKKYEHN